MKQSRKFESQFKNAMEMYNETGDYVYLKKADDYYEQWMIAKREEGVQK